jgi:hypothetical protein
VSNELRSAPDSAIGEWFMVTTPVVSPHVHARKKPVKRAFTGLAGSPLAKVEAAKPQTEAELIARLDAEALARAKEDRRIARIRRKFDKQIEESGVSKSDHTLREPQTADRKEPVAFNTWWDRFNQKHGQIDLDCSFQEYAFDPHLKRGYSADDIGSGSKTSHLTAEDARLYEVFRTDINAGKKAVTGFRTGVLPGGREHKLRRPNASSWWIFDSELLRDFIEFKFDDSGEEDAQRTFFTLYWHYVLGMSDEEIAAQVWTEDSTDERPGRVPDEAYYFSDAKECKSYRQYVVRQGAKRFESLRGKSGFGSRGSKRGKVRGQRCNDPKCNQCSKNEVSLDFT